MTRLPIRVRLTAAFAVAMVVVLASAGLFVYLRLRADLDETITAALRTRAAAVTAAGTASAGGSGDGEESFAQRLRAGGSVLDGAGGVRGPALTAAELRRAGAGAGEVIAERRVAGIEGTARLLARPAGGTDVVLVGQSLEDRDDTLGNLVASFAVGGPIAVLAASLLGYALAATALRPVEAMRRRAGSVSLARGDERLPLPAAHDEIRRLGETLNAMLDRLRRSFERERRFVADASHELRTPLAVVKAELEAALRAGGQAPDVREGLLGALEECDRLGRLAEDLLLIAQSDEHGLALRPEPLDVASLLDHVRHRFADRALERGRTIRIEADAVPSVSADALRLGQALGNLVDNALRHGRGEIVLRGRPLEAGVAFEVADEGDGFAPAFAERAFDRFTRGDPARGRGGGGSGLGLPIARAIAEAHGGRAELVPGAAAVRIWLPAGAVSGPVQVGRLASDRQPTGRRRPA